MAQEVAIAKKGLRVGNVLLCRLAEPLHSQLERLWHPTAPDVETAEGELRFGVVLLRGLADLLHR